MTSHSKKAVHFYSLDLLTPSGIKYEGLWLQVSHWHSCLNIPSDHGSRSLRVETSGFKAVAHFRQKGRPSRDFAAPTIWIMDDPENNLWLKWAPNLSDLHEMVSQLKKTPISYFHRLRWKLSMFWTFECLATVSDPSCHIRICYCWKKDLKLCIDYNYLYKHVLVLFGSESLSYLKLNPEWKFWGMGSAVPAYGNESGYQQNYTQLIRISGCKWHTTHQVSLHQAEQPLHQVAFACCWYFLDALPVLPPRAICHGSNSITFFRYESHLLSCEWSDLPRSIISLCNFLRYLLLITLIKASMEVSPLIFTEAEQENPQFISHNEGFEFGEVKHRPVSLMTLIWGQL